MLLNVNCFSSFTCPDGSRSETNCSSAAYMTSSMQIAKVHKYCQWNFNLKHKCYEVTATKKIRLDFEWASNQNNAVSQKIFPHRAKKCWSDTTVTVQTYAYAHFMNEECQGVGLHLFQSVRYAWPCAACILEVLDGYIRSVVGKCLQIFKYWKRWFLYTSSNVCTIHPSASPCICV